MKTIKTFRDIKLKDQTLIPKGTALVFIKSSESGTAATWNHGGRELCLSYRTVIKTPSFARLERMSEDSVCKSVFGDTVEPDGYGSHDEPSWLLALGLI